MPPPRRNRLRIHEVVLLAFGLFCAAVVAATEDAPRPTPPLVSYGTYTSGSISHGGIESGCFGIVGFFRCR